MANRHICVLHGIFAITKGICSVRECDGSELASFPAARLLGLKLASERCAQTSRFPGAAVCEVTFYDAAADALPN